MVGSSNETTAFPTIIGGFNGTGPGDNWLSIPYHTTYATANQVCVSLGLNTAAGGLIFRRIAGTGGSNFCTCGVAGCAPADFNLVLGEALLVRKNAAGNIVGFLPPHF